MERVIWAGDAVAPTGFSRVTHNVIDRLKQKYEFHILGVNHWGDPHDFDYKIYPAYLSGEPYGFQRLPAMIKSLKPKIVVLFNDTWIINEYLRYIKAANLDLKDVKIVAYFPVDHENIDPRYFKEYDIVDEVCTYTKFAEAQFRNSYRRMHDKDRDVTIVPHGVDLKTFYEMDMKECRRGLYIKEDLDTFMDSFVVFNGNRNSPRKRYDIFLQAFSMFQRGKDDVKAYCHCGLLDEGLDIIRFTTDYGFKNKLVVSTTTKEMPGVSDKMLNKIYNCANVGVNTSMGEGWGLVAFEHAATMKPQIVPNHSACAELWKDIGIVVDVLNQPPHVTPRLNAEFRIPDTYKLLEAMEMVYADWRSGGVAARAMAEKAYETISSHEYSWEYASDTFDKIFRKLL